MRRPSGENVAVRRWRPTSRGALAMAGQDGERLARIRVPGARGRVVGGGHDAPPVGRERGAAKVPLPPRHLVMAGDDGERRARAASQVRAVQSLEAVTMRRPSGEYAALRTESHGRRFRRSASPWPHPRCARSGPWRR